MVCVFCLIPLFLIPVVNALPYLFDLLLVCTLFLPPLPPPFLSLWQSKVYGLFGWEYRRPERVPPACPYKPAAKKNDEGSSESTPLVNPHVAAAAAVGDKKVE
ncbi:hypothetical protein EJB05_19129 [Eragrostis curvula]|uniref:Uncharacterized protein n=1 Tax=Eragrostis curvula TaxID=38414 RepID=A0A5J9UWC5_9POAL|nr:hypothetical protein EJB05_19129 [Eragrostis curvula]